MSLQLYISIALIAFASLVSAQSCLDEAGNPVDWFMQIKGPKVQVNNPVTQAGHSYIYLDSNSIDSSTQFRLSPNDISSSTGAVPYTIQNLYNLIASNGNNQGYLFYNDELPENAPTTKTSRRLFSIQQEIQSKYSNFSTDSFETFGSSNGHTKGVMGFNSKGGFWLIHSTPKFPDAPSTTSATQYSFPDSGSIYGQSFLCLSLGIDQLDLVGQAYQYNNPWIYGEQWPQSLPQSSATNLYDFIVNNKKISAAGSFDHSLSTQQGEKFMLFAKNIKWNQDLYSMLVSPYFQTGLIIETWMRPKEDSYYPPQTKFVNVNVQTMQFPSSAPGVKWGETNDHSKWAISTDGSSSGSISCIGDINRQPSQWKRGGGTVCIAHPNVWKAFKALVTATDPLNN